MVWPPEKANQSLTNLIEHLDVANLELSSYPMLKVIFQSQHAQKLVAWNFAVRHLDYNAHDLSAVVEYSDGIAGVPTLKGSWSLARTVRTPRPP